MLTNYDKFDLQRGLELNLFVILVCVFNSDLFNLAI